MTELQALDTWFYIMLAGVLLTGLSASVFGNGKDKKQRRLIIKFNTAEPAGKTLTGQPVQIMNGRLKPLMLVVGLLLCLLAYIMLIAANGILAFAFSNPWLGSLFLIPVILLLVTLILGLRIFFTKLTIYSNALIIQAFLQRKTYYFDDFTSIEVSVYADRQISYRAFHVSKTQDALKLWLRKPGHFALMQDVFQNNALVTEIISERLDTPYYVRLKELQGA